MVNENSSAAAQRQAMDVAVKEIQHHAGIIFDLMMPGMTMDIAFPDNSNIVVPNAPREMRRLVITRPSLVVKVMPR